ncbi:hypothetical protein FZW96_07700 [Bacillus sp. BGMRC 2118]|nr:hypothetical protein FZW96_07700 [Bacillus sp. BGMRC 2118]
MCKLRITLSRISFLLVFLLGCQQLFLPLKGVLAFGDMVNTSGTTTTEAIHIPDGNLKNAINYLLNRSPESPIFEDDLKGFQILNLSNKNIESIEGLQYATNLQELALNWNQIQDISALANLTNLKKLYLDGNEITDLTPLMNLTNLDNLGLSMRTVTDIEPISHLTKLTYLNLSDHHVTDIHPLSNLTNLERLFLNGDLAFSQQNKIADISPLSNLVNLRELYLSDNNIKDVSPLANLPVLSGLYIQNNQIEDISPLANLPLVVLNVSENQVSSIEALRNHTGMSTLHLHSNLISDISALTNMNRLVDLDVSNNRIRDIEPLKYALPTLKKLNVSFNLLTDINLIESSGLYPQTLNTNYNFIPNRQYQYRISIPSQYHQMEVLGRGPIMIPIEIHADKRYSFEPDYPFNKEKGKIFTVETLNNNIDAYINEEWNLVVTGLSEGEAGVTLSFPNSTLNQTIQVAQVDLTAPAAPKVDLVTDQSGYITGLSEQYAKISLKIGQWTQVTDTYNEGYFYFNLPVYPAGTKMEFTSTDQAGNVSAPTIVEVKDATGPTFTKIDEVTDQSTAVRGIVEAGAMVKVLEGDTLLGSTRAADDGQFEVIIPKQSAGWNVLQIVAVDASGNETTVFVDVRDVTPPSTPIVHDVTDRDTSISGKVDAGVTTINIMKNGVIFAHGLADAEGNFTATIPLQSAGTEIQVQAVENAGNASEIVTVIVQDIMPPAITQVNDVTDQHNTVSGMTEAGVYIEVKAENSIIGSGIAGVDGSFSVNIPLQASGKELVITAIDKANNRSQSVIRTVKDVTSPSKPQVNEVTASSTTITGQAEPGTNVEAKVNNLVIGNAEVNVEGQFTIKIPTQKAGTIIEITVIDSSGNTSEIVRFEVKQMKKYGWVYENNHWYFYDLKTGNIKTGWVYDGAWYYLNSNGTMKTGWLYDGAWYYLNNSGVMQTGWLYDGAWYYLTNSGAMQKGWLYDGAWYYFTTSGVMQTGWIQVGRNWYYLYPTGQMAFNKTIGGYKLGSDGAWVK